MICEGKRPLLGVLVDAVDYEYAVSEIIDAARERRSLGVTAIAVHGVMTGALDAEQRYRLNRLDLKVPDGQPVKWGLNLIHKTGLTERVYGPELMRRVCESASREGLPVYFYGSSEHTLHNLVSNLEQRMPALKVAGAQASRFRRISETEMGGIAADINASGAALIFVGLGCPRQEVWVYEFSDLVPLPRIAVGAAFDFHAGTLQQAPAWMQQKGLEWLFRLVSEPKRLWRRYLTLNPAFVFLLLMQWMNLYTIQPEDARRPGAPIGYA